MRIVSLLLAVTAISTPAISQTVVQRFPPQGPIPSEVIRTGFPIPQIGPYAIGQTITADSSGLLNRFEVLLLGELPSDLQYLPIVTLSIFDSPGGKKLGAGSFSAPETLSLQTQWVGVDLTNEGIFLNAGSQIFATVTMDQANREGLDVTWYGWAAPEGLAYAGGEMLQHSWGNWNPQQLDGLDIDLSHRLTIDTAVQAPAVPEPATWAMLITGFGLVGASLRRRKVVAA